MIHHGPVGGAGNTAGAAGNTAGAARPASRRQIDTGTLSAGGFSLAQPEGWTAYASLIGGVFFHLPRVKSGKSMGVLLTATERSLSGEMTLHVTAS